MSRQQIDTYRPSTSSHHHQHHEDALPQYNKGHSCTWDKEVGHIYYVASCGIVDRSLLPALKCELAQQQAIIDHPFQSITITISIQLPHRPKHDSNASAWPYGWLALWYVLTGLGKGWSELQGYGLAIPHNLKHHKPLRDGKDGIVESTPGSNANHAGALFNGMTAAGLIRNTSNTQTFPRLPAGSHLEGNVDAVPTIVSDVPCNPDHQRRLLCLFPSLDIMCPICGHDKSTSFPYPSRIREHLYRCGVHCETCGLRFYHGGKFLAHINCRPAPSSSTSSPALLLNKWPFGLCPDREVLTKLHQAKEHRHSKTHGWLVGNDGQRWINMWLHLRDFYIRIGCITGVIGIPWPYTGNPILAPQSDNALQTGRGTVRGSTSQSMSQPYHNVSRQALVPTDRLMLPQTGQLHSTAPLGSHETLLSLFRDTSFQQTLPNAQIYGSHAPSMVPTLSSSTTGSSFDRPLYPTSETSSFAIGVRHGFNGYHTSFSLTDQSLATSEHADSQLEPSIQRPYNEFHQPLNQPAEAQWSVDTSSYSDDMTPTWTNLSNEDNTTLVGTNEQSDGLSQMGQQHIDTIAGSTNAVPSTVLNPRAMDAFRQQDFAGQCDPLLVTAALHMGLNTGLMQPQMPPGHGDFALTPLAQHTPAHDSILQQLLIDRETALQWYNRSNNWINSILERRFTP